MRYLLFTLVCCFGLTSCEKEIPFEVDDDGNKLVVNCFIGPNMETVVAYVSKSQSVISVGAIETLPNATVTLFKNGTSLGTMTSAGEGKFTLDHTPEIGATYRIEASANGLDPVQAETTIPTEPVLNSISTPEIVDNDLVFDVTIADDANQENFYQLLLLTADEFGTNLAITGFSSNSPLLANNSNPFGDNNEYFYDDAFFTDSAFNGENITLELSVYYVQTNFTLQFLNCSEAYYLYKRTLLNYYQNNDNPFAQPVQIYSNIEGGLGIFAGYSYQQIDIVY